MKNKTEKNIEKIKNEIINEAGNINKKPPLIGGNVTKRIIETYYERHY